MSTILTSNSSSMVTGIQTTTEAETTTVVYNTHPFLQTAACQTVAGVFTWAAIFITGYHVKSNLKIFLFLFNN